MVSGGGSSANWKLRCWFPRGSYYTNWTDRVQFAQASGLYADRVEAAADWLIDHVKTLELPTKTGKLVAWNDATLNNDLVAYLMTDNLWVLKALMPYDTTLSNTIKQTLIDLGWYGNRQHDTLFHGYSSVAHKPIQLYDYAQGTWLGNCAASGSGTVQVRVPIYIIDRDFTNGHPNLFVDSAVFQALNEYWNGYQSAAYNYIANAIQYNGAADQMWWDTNISILFDAATSEACKDSPGGVCNAPFKIGLLLYALNVMNINDFPYEASQMSQRLREAQHSHGGVAHQVDYFFNIPILYGPTAEATSIAILAHTVQ